jgi:hypothetical protein
MMVTNWLVLLSKGTASVGLNIFGRSNPIGCDIGILNHLNCFHHLQSNDVILGMVVKEMTRIKKQNGNTEHSILLR